MIAIFTINGNSNMANEALTDPLRETIAVFSGTEPRTTNEVAETLGLNRRTAYARLDRLADENEVLTKKVGANARVWWRPNRPSGIVGEHFEVRTDDLLDHVFDDVGVGIVVVNADKEIVWMNRTVEDYFDLDRDTVIGRDKPTVVAERIAPRMADPDAFHETIRSTYEDMGTGATQFECRIAEGERSQWLEHRSKPIEGGPLAGGRVELYYDITDLRLTQQASRERSEEFHSLVDAVEEYAIFTLDTEGNVRTWNPGARRIKGYESDEILGEHFSTFYPEEAREDGIPSQNLEIAAADGSLEDSGWRVRKDGSKFWANVSISPILNEAGELTGFAKVTRDMTRQRTYERRLEQQARRLERRRDELERELEDIFRRIQDAYIAIDDDWRITYANERATDLVDIPAGELIGADVWETFPEIPESEYRERAKQALETGEDFEFEFYSEILERWIEVRCFGTEAGLSVYFRDVTDRKEYEQELVRINTQLEAATQAGKIGTWDWDIQEDEFFTGAWFAELFAVSPEDVRAGVSLDQHLEAIHDEDRPQVERAIDEAIETCGDYEEEYRVRDADGDIRWVVARGEVECDEDGEPLHFPGAVMDITGRKRSEMALEQRSEQQRAVADLGQLALADQELGDLTDMACEWIAEILDTDFCQVLEHDDERGALRAVEAVGWQPDLGGAHLSGQVSSLGEFVMQSEGAVTIEDLQEDDRFAAPEAFHEHGVRSGIATLIGPADDPWGILSTYDREPGEFPREDVIFVQSMANVLANAIDRTEREARLAARRDELATLNHLNTVVTDLTGAVIEGSTRSRIEEIVCEALAASPAYTFAWIAEADPHAEELRERASADTAGYPQDVSVPLDPDGAEPTPPGVAALREHETQVVTDVFEDPRVEPYRNTAETYGFTALASIPIVHDGTAYGVLGVYTDRENAFDEAEVDVISKIGGIVGHAIASTERQRALMSDELVELEFRIRDVFEARDRPPIEGTVEFEHVVPLGDEEFVIYGATTPGAVDGLRSLVDEIDAWESLSVREEGERTRFELRVVQSPLLSVVASVGGYVERAAVENGQLQLTVHVAPSADVRQLIESIEEIYPEAEMVRRRQISRPGEESRHPRREIVGDLTDRQREVLEIALHSGYFEWPREASGEDVAETIGIAPATFSQHLRRAQRHVFDRLLPHPA